jgi:hypothetical protein
LLCPAVFILHFANICFSFEGLGFALPQSGLSGLLHHPLCLDEVQAKRVASPLFAMQVAPLRQNAKRGKTNPGGALN